MPTARTLSQPDRQQKKRKGKVDSQKETSSHLETHSTNNNNSNTAAEAESC